MFELTPFVRRQNVATYDPFREFEKAFFGGEDDMMRFRTDIKDSGKAYELEAELPGFDKDDIKLDVDGDYLTITAEHKDENDEKDKKGNYIRRERYYGSYTRSFDVSNIDVDNIDAGYKDGVLKLTLPKKEAKAPETKRLEIK